MHQVCCLRGRAAALLLAATLLGTVAAAPPEPRLLDVLAARPIGPANMSGRVVDVAVVESHPATMYVATATGGLWKTTNRGTTWTPVFDNQAVAALGDVAVAPSDPRIVWLGTGEANARNSVSWGDGVYRSSDGGATWQHRGLRDSAHVGRIVLHPADPNTVYVAALGRLWGPSAERGVFRTTDGGATWQRVLYLDDDTGCVDLVMDPANPATLLAALYRVRRDAFSGGNPAVQFSTAAGLYRTTDGGTTWTRLTAGLPDRPLGRCGLDICRADPRIVYAVVQTDLTDIRTVPGQGPGSSGRLDTGGVFRSADGGTTWTKVNDLCPRPFYFGQVRVDPADPRRVYVLGVPLFVSDDSGQTFRDNGAAGVHADHHALWINPHDSAHLVLGCDGGLNVSHDRGATWEHFKNLPVAQFYAVAVDQRRPYRVYGGLQDNGTWAGPSATHRPEGITTADWFKLYDADGFQCQVDPADPDTVYAEGQYGRLQRIHLRTGEAVPIRPAPPEGAPAYRFNWCAPLVVSAHDPHTLYYGGNHVFRSTDRGGHWDVVSPDLTRGPPGPSPSMGHTLTALAESPLRRGLLYAGSDDGRVHVTRSGGAVWTDVSARLPGVPADRCITRIECSRGAEGTAYLALSRHRHDDRAPYLFRTTDHGATWQPLRGNLPPGGPIHVVREDPRNPELLYVGTEFGLFLSLDGGATWHRHRAGLPTVPVHDLVVHPRDRELVIATHGRGIYILDVAPLQELTARVRAEPFHLCDVKPARAGRAHGTHGQFGSREYAAPNPPAGATLTYYLREATAEPVHLVVTDGLGGVVIEVEGKTTAGLHRLTWDLCRPGTSEDEPGPAVDPGEYLVRLQVGVQVVTKRLRVEKGE